MLNLSPSTVIQCFWTETLCPDNYMAKYQAKNLDNFPFQSKGPHKISTSTPCLFNPPSPPPPLWSEELGYNVYYSKIETNLAFLF